MISISLIPSEISFQCVLMYVCVCVYIQCAVNQKGVLDWMCFQVHRQLHKSSAGEHSWQQMTDRPHVDLRCLKRAARGGKFYTLKTIIQHCSSLTVYGMVWYEQIRGSQDGARTWLRVEVKTSADRSLQM